MSLHTVAGPTGRPVIIPPGVGVLVPFVEGGVFGSYEVQFAAAVLRLQPGLGSEELLALAVAARAPRFGHVCTPLEAMAVRLAELDGEEAPDLPWPAAHDWAARLSGSSVVATAPHGSGPLRPLVWDGDRLYLHRYWHYELAVADDLARRCRSVPSGSPGWWAGTTGQQVDQVLDALFGAEVPGAPDLQRLAARRALAPGVSIIAGGPGTGKTYTVARLLAAAHLMASGQGRPLSVALAAPTGKAAARMGEAVQSAVAGLELAGGTGGVAGLVAGTAPSTIHSLLGREDRTHFRHDRDHPLPEDMVIIDETSMVSLPLMAKLLDAVRPEASVVLVGDPYQLASIEAGTVMSDVVGPAGRTSGAQRAPRRGAGGGDTHPVGLVGGTGSADDRPTGSWPTGSPFCRPCGDSRGTPPSPPWPTPSAPATATGPWALLERGATDLRWVRPDDGDGLIELTAELVAVGEELVLAATGGRSRRPGRGRPDQGAGRHPAGPERHDRVDRADRAWGGPADRRVPPRAPLARRTSSAGHGQRPGQSGVQR